MKKIIISLIWALCASFSVSFAQKVESKSRLITVIEEPKTPSLLTSNWIIRAGAGIMSCEEYYGNKVETVSDVNLAFGYQREINLKGLYWGVQIGLTGIEAYHGKYVGPYLGPTLGFRRGIANKTQIDGHIGISGGYSLGGGHNEYGTGAVLWELGVGIWYKNFLVELEYMGHSGYYNVASAALLNLGFRF